MYPDIKKAIDDYVKRIEEREREARRKMKPATIDARIAAEETLGYTGKMLSGSKKSPEGETIVWNSNVCTKKHGKIWFGDLNITRDIDKLKELAIRIKDTVYVLREHDARFEYEYDPRFNEAVFAAYPSGVVAWGDMIQ